MGSPTVIGTESRFFTGLFDDREKIKASTSMLAFFTRGETSISLFNDVEEGSWYKPFANYAKANKLFFFKEKRITERLSGAVIMVFGILIISFF